MGRATFQAVLPLVLVVLGMHPGARAFTITVTSPNPQSGTAPNTFIGTSDQIASSLLDSETPGILWGLVTSADVDGVCKQVVESGNLSFSATLVDTNTQATEEINLQIDNVGGCEASSAESGTEAVMIDNYGRRSALVCPSNAWSIGCAVYLTGDDVKDLYNQGSRRKLLASRSRKLLDCQEGAGKGAISGTIFGVLALGDCLGLGPLAPFCVIGVLGASAEVGAAAGCATGAVCFPGDAMVEIASGELKKMTQLALGDKVAVRKGDGSIAYEDIYAFGHRDPTAIVEFLKLTMTPLGINISESHENRVLDLSALHFAPVLSGDGPQSLIYKRAKDIKVGDTMWATWHSHGMESEMFARYIVRDISTIMKQGLYNPFTMSGTIVVNGVLASVHSEWFLDGMFDYLGLTHLLPIAYQAALAPPRILYSLLGKNAYVAVYTWLDLRFNFVQLVSDYSGAASMSAIVAIIASSVLLVNKKKEV